VSPHGAAVDRLMWPGADCAALSSTMTFADTYSVPFGSGIVTVTLLAEPLA
jgi:hypothetical protein